MLRQLFTLVFVLGLAGLFGGCGTVLPGHLGGIATRVAPEEYAEHLCAHLPLNDYSACFSEVIGYFEVAQPHQDPRGPSNAGPIALVIGQRVFAGRYDSAPLLAGNFRVTEVAGAVRCDGYHNAAGDSRDALYDVHCSDGRSGWADLILDTGGRNGIGKVAFTDGSEGSVIFGYTALGQPVAYPYVQ